MTESALIGGILLALGSRTDCRVWRQNTGRLPDRYGRWITFGVPGCPDILGVLRPSGRLISIEVKTATGRLRPEQIAFRDMLVSHGALYILARSIDDAVRAVEAA